MKKMILSVCLLLMVSFSYPQSAERFYPASELISVGAYYYPEHWDESVWERDLKQMAEMGFEFTHYGEFAWAQLEPEEGKYDFDWLDRAIELADKYGLKVILCTSTATPPVWLVRKYPEVLITHEDGTRMDHGARQHASFSSSFYREYSQKMIAELAIRYGNDERVIGWQLDNEPRTSVDYGSDAHERFRAWLKEKYGTIEALNKAWGNDFWSGLYNDFSQINIPLHSQWGMNLHQRLDHTRFSDWETSSFMDKQARTIRKHIKRDQWITTNYIPMYDVRYIGQSRELDFVTYTRYMIYGEGLGVGRKGYRIGEPLRIAMANDYFRPLSEIIGVMELQPGQVNWGQINPQPLPGAVRLWNWHVFAGGSKFTCTYRFRAPLYGYEQYHYGIMDFDGVRPSPGGLEFQQFIEEINLLRENYSGSSVPDDYLKRYTGVLFDPNNAIAMAHNPQTTEWHTENHVLKYYKALKSFGAPVDFVRDTMDISKYPVLVVPAYQQISRDLIQNLTAYAQNGGHLVMTVRTGHQDPYGHLWEAPYAQPIYDLIGSEIEFYDLLMPHAPDNVKMDGEMHPWTSWGEILKPFPGTESWATFEDDFYAGKPAVTWRKLGNGTVTYVGVDTHDGQLEHKVLTRVFERANIKTESYPEGILVEYRDGFGVAMNYSDKNYEVKIPSGSQILVGQPNIAPAEVVVWKVE
ncbi:beta-galactosidase [Alkalitalea saponilacus]|nr:beta-galactosidase [Alkalitalea saponilacus]ASB51067.1 beta-galactosidase [Alkalitalea saponilacus]